MVKPRTRKGKRRVREDDRKGGIEKNMGRRRRRRINCSLRNRSGAFVVREKFQFRRYDSALLRVDPLLSDDHSPDSLKKEMRIRGGGGEDADRRSIRNGNKKGGRIERV